MTNTVLIAVVCVQLAACSYAQGEVSASDRAKLRVVSRAFKESDVDLGLYLNTRKAMNDLKSAGLDTLTPIKAAGVDIKFIQKGDDTFNLANAGLRLLAAGLDEERVHACFDCAIKNKLKVGEMEYTKLLLCALRRTGQNSDSLQVEKAIVEAIILSSKENDGMIAFIAADINVNAIVPMGKDFMFKIEDLLPKKRPDF